MHKMMGGEGRLFEEERRLVRRGIHLGGERHCESKASCPRTEHNVPGQGSSPDRSNGNRNISPLERNH